MAVEDLGFECLEKRTGCSLIIFLLDLSGNMLLKKVEQVVEVLLIVDKSVNREFVIIFGAEKFLKSGLFLLKV